MIETAYRRTKKINELLLKLHRRTKKINELLLLALYA